MLEKRTRGMTIVTGGGCLEMIGEVGRAVVAVQSLEHAEALASIRL